MSDNTVPVDDLKLYRITEVARITGHDPRNLRRWAADGYLEGARREGPTPTSPFVIPGKTVRMLLANRTIEGTE